MFNLWRAECYKLRKSKSLLVCALVIVGVIFMMYGMLTVADRIANGDWENGTAGVVVSQPGEEELSFSLKEMNAADVLQQMFSGDLMALVLACFVSVFIAAEYGSGAVKNIVGKGYSRGTIFLARYLAVVVGMILLLAFGAAADLAGALIVLGKDAFYVGVWKDMGAYMGMQLFICAGLGAVFALVADIGRGMAAAITMCIGTVILPELLMGVLDMAFARMGFQPSQYWLVSMCERCPVGGMEAGDAAKTVGIALCWIAAALAVGIWHFKKTDIK